MGEGFIFERCLSKKCHGGGYAMDAASELMCLNVDWLFCGNSFTKMCKCTIYIPSSVSSLVWDYKKKVSQLLKKKLQ